MEEIGANGGQLPLMCPNTSRPFFGEIPVQKTAGFPPEFTTPAHNNPLLERFLRWPIVELLTLHAYSHQGK
jgi:hypothetical protein